MLLKYKSSKKYIILKLNIKLQIMHVDRNNTFIKSTKPNVFDPEQILLNVFRVKKKKNFYFSEIIILNKKLTFLPFEKPVVFSLYLPSSRQLKVLICQTVFSVFLQNVVLVQFQVWIGSSKRCILSQGNNGKSVERLNAKFSNRTEEKTLGQIMVMARRGGAETK